MERSELITFRDYGAADEAFIYHTWISGYRYGCELFKDLPKTEDKRFYTRYHRAVESILSHSTVKLACLVDDETTIIGFSVYEETPLENIVHWVFVKPAWREIGIAKDLVPKPIHLATHMTRMAERIMKKHNIEFIGEPHYEQLEAKTSLEENTNERN